ncbi:PAAR domain-containing protein [Psychrobacter sp. AOP42-A1-21]
MVAYITVGAKTTHGGTVITGSPQTTHYGIPIARKGDKVVCKKCKKVVTIITGDPSYIVDGAPVARAGDMTSCGSKLIASQQAFSESGFDVGSISDEMTDEELYALNDQMIEDAIADGGLMAFSSTKGLTNDSKAPKKPTKYNKDGTEKTQKQINDAWKAYYDHKHKVEAEALARQKEE